LSDPAADRAASRAKTFYAEMSVLLSSVRLDVGDPADQEE
jgi:hypothetical protein